MVSQVSVLPNLTSVISPWTGVLTMCLGACAVSHMPLRPGDYRDREKDEVFNKLEGLDGRPVRSRAVSLKTQITAVATLAQAG